MNTLAGLNGAGLSLLALLAAPAAAFDLPNGRKDAAIRIPFSPGGYTVHAIDASGGSGIAIIELYESP